MAVSIDRKNIPRSYREYLKKMVEMGEFFEIDEEVDWNLPSEVSRTKECAESTESRKRTGN